MSSLLLNDLINFNEIFKKKVPYDKLKIHQKPGQKFLIAFLLLISVTSLLLIMALRFICDKSKICSAIKMSQNIMNIIVSSVVCESSERFSQLARIHIPIIDLYQGE